MAVRKNSQTDCHRHVVTLDNVTFAFDRKPVIGGIDLHILERDFVGLVGANGAGKTTLLRLIVGLLKPTSGVVKLFDEPLEKFRDWERIGYVPQKNAFNPLFPATVGEVVLSGLYGRKKMFRRVTPDDRRKCAEAMEVMGIEDLAARKVGQLSGGQQQRTFLARALVGNPDLLILDEPTVGIDAETQANFFKLIRHMHQHHNMTLLMVSHDLDMLKSYIGEDPVKTAGKLKFYIKHTHNPEDCGETSLAHTLAEYRRREREEVT
ncbi:MAG: ABC transporter ATP-binding protein [Paenibacillaceae bacterium]|nr:ABC transporter ATP-binding protein [Paenibacillaceae bacterium]